MVSINNFISELQFFLEKIDKHRDKVLFVFIKPFWPRLITPNCLTFARVIIGLFLFFLLFYYKNDDASLVILLFFIGISTDLLDGSVARGLKRETKLGAMMDPIADRILIVPIAIYSLFGDHRWLLLILILLEVLNALISVYAQSKNIFIQSNIFGKTKMLFQSVAFTAILVFWPKTPNLFFIWMFWLSVILMVISIYVKFLEIKKVSA